jgi:hypothetical protein
MAVRNITRTMLLVSILLLLWSCAPQLTPAPEVETGGVVVRAMTSEPASLDPQGAPSSGLSLVWP